jgi:hypothetical protein
MRQAILRGRSFNVIHFKSSYKFDVFPMARDEFSRSQMARRGSVDLTPLGIAGVSAPAASAEDTILAKLRWYRLGGESSEQQWKDLKGVVEVRRVTLDYGYLRQWAQDLGVADLLDELLA